MDETLRSVLDQQYPRLEYIVADGGSTDGSVEIIHRHAHQLAFWVSEPDRGQYDAINKGFARSSGEIMGWLNSDDRQMPWTPAVVGEIFAAHPRIEWLTTLFPLGMDEQGRIVTCRQVDGYSRGGFLSGENLPGGKWRAHDFIQQEGTFWRRSLWDRAGGSVDASLKYAGDFDLWARFFAGGAELCGVGVPLAAFRYQQDQKTALHSEDYIREAHAALFRHGGRPPGRWQSFVRAKLDKLHRHFGKRYDRSVRSGSPGTTCWHTGRQGAWELHHRA